MFEYNRFEFKFNKNELADKLNFFGDDNWEVIHYEEEKPMKFGGNYNCIIIVKRLKEKPVL